jgi:LacI family transcriptional regulator
MSGDLTGRPTQKDVARLAGVAPPTVSFILRKVEPKYSQYARDTIKRVEQAAAELGYVPNMLATSLRDRRLPFFGIFFDFVRARDVSSTGGLPAMMWQLYEGIANTARKAGRYPVLLASPGADVSLADDPGELDRVVRSGLSGVIAAVHETTWKDHLSRWERLGVPCISLFEAGDLEQPRWHVDLDNRAVGRQAWEYLRDQGHQCVLCPLGKNPSRAAADRVDALKEAQKRNGGELHVLDMTCWNEVEGQYDPEGKRLIIEALNKTKATAIFGNSGGMTTMSHEALCDAGFKVPDDCSLMGIDVLEIHGAFDVITQFLCPGLEIGRAAAELLERRIGGATGNPERTLVQPVLRERSSVARLPI